MVLDFKGAPVKVNIFLKIPDGERLAIAFKQDPYLEQFRYFMKLLDQYRSSGCDIRFVSIGATPESELITKHVEEKQTKNFKHALKATPRIKVKKSARQKSLTNTYIF